MSEPKRRLRACVENWPDAETGEHNPACCRFPKSCSATAYDPDRVAEADLEPQPKRKSGDAPGLIRGSRFTYGHIVACRLCPPSSTGAPRNFAWPQGDLQESVEVLAEHQRAEHVDAVFRGDRGGPLGMAMDRTSERSGS